MISELSVAELGRAFRDGTLSPSEVTEHYLARVQEFDSQLLAFSALDPEQALDQAEKAGKDLKDGRDRGPMHGVPIAVKDLLFTKDLPTRGGSPIYGDFVPDEDDVVVERLRDGGAIVLGKTNTAEFGFSGNHTTNALLGPTSNPWALDRTTGGSSGGSASAVAAGLVPIAVGSDGGGSVRIPSAYCGTFGHKPTFGLVPLYPGCRDPRYPGFSGWESLEHIGPIARTPEDAAAFLDVVVGLDQRDRHSVVWNGPSFAAAMRQTNVAGLRVAVSTDWAGHAAVDGAVAEHVVRTAELLGSLGATVLEAAPEHLNTREAFGSIVATDLQPNALRELAGRHPGAVGERLLSIANLPRDVGAIGDGQRVRQALYLTFARFFEEVDIWITPTVPVTAFSHDEVGPPLIGGQVPADLHRSTMDFVYPANLTGHPAASLPVGTVDGLPVGVQVLGRRFEDATVLGVAEHVRQAGSWLGTAPAFVAASL